MPVQEFGRMHICPAHTRTHAYPSAPFLTSIAITHPRALSIAIAIAIADAIRIRVASA